MLIKVAIDARPMKTASRYRGIGIYTQNLIEALVGLKRKNLLVTLIEKGTIPEDCQVVHYPYFDPFRLSLPLIKIKPTIVTIHDVTPLVMVRDYPPGIKGKLRLLIQKFSLGSVRAVITDSENSKKDIFKYLNYPLERIEVVYLAAGKEFRPIKTPAKLMAAQIKYHLPQEFVLYVGDVNNNKNLPGLVRTCEKIGLPLVVVGKQAREENIDREHPENRDLVWFQDYHQRHQNGTHKIYLLGFVGKEDLAAIYNLASVYCQVSFYEGFGLPVLEAMACGCPVVASNASSLPEIGGKAAIFVNPYDINDISRGVIKVIRDKKMRDKMVEMGLEQSKKFSWQKTAQKTYEVYRKVAQG